MKNYPKSHEFDEDLIYEAIMGPNPLYFAEELCETMKLEPGMRVLDLGCGGGLSSMFIAKETGATVFATDLWVKASDNYERFKKAGFGDSIIPIHADAHDLPYADGYFDAVFCIDSYQYYGVGGSFFDDVLLKLVKPGGQIGLAFAGFNKEQKTAPEFLAKYWMDDGSDTFHSLEKWTEFFTKSKNVELVDTHYIEDGREIWYEWARIARKRNNFDDDKVLDGDREKLLALMTLTLKKL